ncbi:MAG: T9SS type A sorting domain-containing protein, partial [Candidatus Neomarinimicrobiota bacterium]|nr:T9SS type A sorting domain-containing protein [Candidatus Neomarinimicrobiota bacterium]
MDGPWSELGSGGSSRLMIFELDSVVDDSAIFSIEYEDSVWTNWSGYNISTGDLDNDGLMEIYTVAYEYYHIIIHENSGEDQYEYQTDFYVCSEQHQRGNQSLLVTDLDENGTNELFGVTSGTNTLSGDLLTPGLFFAVQGVDDVSALSYGNFNFFASYAGGLRQINTGDTDGDGKPNLYLAGHYNEAVYDWEYNGGDPLAVESFTERIIFLDDTTDNSTVDDNGKVRVAKLFPGDIDSDGYGDIIFSSASFAGNKPTLFMIEHDGTLKTDYSNYTIPNHVSVSQNFPNPFNPATQFSYTLNESGTIFLGIYDIMGKLIYTVYDGFQRAGNHNVFWTGLDQNKRPVSSGVYFYRLVTQS